MTSSLLIIAAQNPLEIIGGVTTFIFGVVAAAFLAAKLIQWFAKTPPEQPKLAGTSIPDLGDGLDISKSYDVVYGGDLHSHFVERLQCVRIVGYVGNEGDESVSKMYMRGRWLAFESKDGRRSYVMPHAIDSLQESARSE